ncbi:hypothetical protein [Chloroflexus sp.]|uniref:hypothetical protein n=1 Tax=Chloroflexus sp. TaxID=1904827 RepID=UPI002ACD4374|nr:hypothetical protein [Chloroflexus sp.]
MTTILAQSARLWLDILWLALAVWLAKGTWFSASAVAPALTAEWRLDDTVRAWLTMSVQLGFAVGAFGSAALGLADRWPTHWFFAGAATLAALCTVLIALFAEGPGLALPLRFPTGMALAGVGVSGRNEDYGNVDAARARLSDWGVGWRANVRFCLAALAQCAGRDWRLATHAIAGCRVGGTGGCDGGGGARRAAAGGCAAL